MRYALAKGSNDFCRWETNLVRHCLDFSSGLLCYSLGALSLVSGFDLGIQGMRRGHADAILIEEIATCISFIDDHKSLLNGRAKAQVFARGDRSEEHTSELQS